MVNEIMSKILASLVFFGMIGLWMSIESTWISMALCIIAILGVMWSWSK